MVTWKDDLVERARRKDRRLEAERVRALYSAGLMTSPAQDWSRARLVRLGAWLEQLGRGLQHRYGPQTKIKVHMLSAMKKASGGC